jgi:vacuolar-type H+-ATPase subunit E/Vma4
MIDNLVGREEVTNWVWASAWIQSVKKNVRLLSNKPERVSLLVEADEEVRGSGKIVITRSNESLIPAQNQRWRRA